MPILKQIKTPAGAELGYHLVMRVEADMRGIHGVAMVTLASWPTESDCVASGELSPVSVSHPAVPLQGVLGASSLLAGIEAALIDAPDSPLQGGTVVPEAGGLEAARVRQWAMIKQTREILSRKPIVVDGLTFQANAASVDEITREVQWLQIAGSTTTEWTLANDTRLQVTRAQLEAVIVAVGQRGQHLHQVSAELRAQLDAAASTEAVLAVVWPTQVPAQ
ncbi:UNVERIFIED_ORG: DUF4376 domain-containing protein [Shinella sp. XGS7]|nr:DUF4376 domain-containing protein [Shinella sp. XGS7]